MLRKLFFILTVAFALTALTMLLSCSGKIDALPEDSYVLSVDKPSLSAAGVSLSASALVLSQSGLVQIDLRLKNRTFHALTVDPAALELLYGESFTAPAFSVTPEEYTLKAFSSRSYKLLFKPINNTYLFQRYQLTGDLLREYRLNLSFIHDAQGIPLFDTALTLAMDEQSYLSYKQKSGIEDQLVSYSLSGDAGQFSAQQREYLEQTGITEVENTHTEEEEGSQVPEGETPAPDTGLFVLVTGDELYLDQWLFKIAPYYTDGTLSIHVRIINRLPNQLKLYAPELKVWIGDQQFTPLEDFSAVKQMLSPLNRDFGPETLIIGQNDRANFTLRYAVSEAPETFNLHLDGVLTFQDVMVFANDLRYHTEAVAE